MKNLLVAVFCLFSFALSAQNMAVKINPFGLLFGSAGAGFEYGITDNISLEGGASFSSRKATLNGESDVKFNGVGFYVSPKLYFKSSPVIEGLYIAPIFKYSQLKGEDSAGDSATSKYSNFGLLFGKQWVWGEDAGFLLDLGIGAGKASASSDDSVGIDVDGILPILRVAIGYAF